MSEFVGTQIRFSDAVIEALRTEMHRNPAITCFTAGSSPVADGLSQAFGDGRLVRTPAVGAPVILAAAGAADQGLRPVCDLGPQEGGTAALDQLAELGAIHAAGGGEYPLTVRLEWGDPVTGGGAAAADPLAFVIGAAGLKLVEPATPADAKGLLVSALRDDEPVCVLEHIGLLESIDTVPEGSHEVEIGRARLAREGESLTVVAHGIGVRAAQRAIDDDTDADLIDLRTLQPLDTDAVLSSIRKTGRAIFVESPIGGERVTNALLGAVWERAFEYLDAPLGRVDAGSGTDDEEIEAIGKACDELLAY